MSELWAFLLEFVPRNNPYQMMWAGIGLAGQALFMSRFLIQLWRSEKVKRSVIPIEFWYLSIAGGLVTLSYAIQRRDLVFTLAQMLGLIVYLRNLYLIYHERQRLAAEGSSFSASPTGHGIPAQGAGTDPLRQDQNRPEGGASPQV